MNMKAYVKSISLCDTAENFVFEITDPPSWIGKL